MSCSKTGGAKSSITQRQWLAYCSLRWWEASPCLAQPPPATCYGSLLLDGFLERPSMQLTADPHRVISRRLDRDNSSTRNRPRGQFMGRRHIPSVKIQRTVWSGVSYMHEKPP